jgi:hypothetical protein
MLNYYNYLFIFAYELITDAELFKNFLYPLRSLVGLHLRTAF